MKGRLIVHANDNRRLPADPWNGISAFVVLFLLIVAISAYWTMQR